MGNVVSQQKNNNREIRVFLSSTFRDMQHERDYLIKKIFPQIRHACRERLVEFTEVDLRWGVTQEEAEQGKVVRICLEEIDRWGRLQIHGWVDNCTILWEIQERVVVTVPAKILFVIRSGQGERVSFSRRGL